MVIKTHDIISVIYSVQEFYILTEADRFNKIKNKNYISLREEM